MRGFRFVMERKKNGPHGKSTWPFYPPAAKTMSYPSIGIIVKTSTFRGTAGDVRRAPSYAVVSVEPTASIEGLPPRLRYYVITDYLDIW